MKVNVLKSAAFEVLLLNAMSEVKGLSPNDFLEHYGITTPNPSPMVEVEVRVNGVVVPFVEVAEVGLDLMVKRYEADVKRAALDLLKGSRLYDLQMALEQAEWRIEDEISKLEVPQ